jgi:TonB family protein
MRSDTLKVAVFWGDRLMDVRPLNKDEEGFARAGAQFSDGALRCRVYGAGEIERVPRGWPTRKDLPFLILVGGLLVAFAFSATLAVRYEPEEAAEPMLTRAATTMIRTVFHPPPRVEVLKAQPRDAQEREQVRSQSLRASNRPLKVKDAGLLGALDALGGSPVLENTGLHERIGRSLEKLSGLPSADASEFSGMNARHSGGGGPGSPFGIGGIGSTPRHARGDSIFALTGLKKGIIEPEQPPTVVGGEGLSRDVVAKVIARHQNEIRFCYERVLQSTPGLGGKVAVLFTIDAAGSVAQLDVAESSLGSAEVERCMLQRIGRWKFPEPKGGGVVSVNFPWVFKQAGSSDSE